MTRYEILCSALRACGLPLPASVDDCEYNAAMVFDSAAERLLSEHDWNFATRLATLFELTPPAFGFKRAYRLPDDCLRVASARPGFDERSPEARWRRYGAELHTNSHPCNIRYIASGIPCEQWPPHFCHAVASLIAADIAGLAAEKMGLVPQLLQLHQLKLAQAQAADAREARAFMPKDETMARARDEAAG